MKDIKRRRNINQSSQQQHHKQQQPGVHILQPGQTSDACIELGEFGLETEAERLKRDRNILKLEIAKLRQQQQSSRAQVIAMEQRIRGTERKQKQMMVFLSKALKNPGIVQQLSLRSEEKQQQQQQLLENAGRKRRLPLQASEGLGADLEIENMISAMADDCGGSSSSSHLMLESSNETVDGISGVIWEELLAEGLVRGDGPEEEEGVDKEVGVDMEVLVGDAIHGWGDDLQNLVDQMEFLGSPP